MSKGRSAEAQKSEVLQGTLDLMVLKVLDALGPQHGYGIARRIEQVSEQVLQLNEGTVYTSLLRLQQRKWIASDWGTSENNRKAKYYSITKSGRKQLARETENWERIAGVIGRLLKLEGHCLSKGQYSTLCCPVYWTIPICTSKLMEWKHVRSCVSEYEPNKRSSLD
jgi:PadR family transcriptional regulator